MSFLYFEFEEGNQMKIKGWGKEKKNNYIHLCMNVMSMKCLYKTCQIRIWLYRLYPMYKLKNSKIINCLKKMSQHHYYHFIACLVPFQIL